MKVLIWRWCVLFLLPLAIAGVCSAREVWAWESDQFYFSVANTTLPKVQGLGVFAKLDFPANEVICEYRGAVVPGWYASGTSYEYDVVSSEGENLKILGDSKNSICPLINDCVQAFDQNYTDSELIAFVNSSVPIPLFPGYFYNAAPVMESSGKVFIVSLMDIPAGSEVFYSYGSRYWVYRIKLRQLEEQS